MKPDDLIRKLDELAANAAGAVGTMMLDPEAAFRAALSNAYPALSAALREQAAEIERLTMQRDMFFSFDDRDTLRAQLKTARDALLVIEEKTAQPLRGLNHADNVMGEIEAVTTVALKEIGGVDRRTMDALEDMDR